MLQNLQKLFQRDSLIVKYILEMRDVRNVGLLVFTIMVLLVTWSSVKAIQTNYVLQRQVEKLQRENEIARLENDTIRLQNGYYNTSQYLEIAARQNYGLAAPGETVLIIPKKVAMSNTVAEPRSNESITAKELPKWQDNIQEWTNFFLHRG